MKIYLLKMGFTLVEINFEYLKNLRLKHVNGLTFISIWNYFYHTTYMPRISQLLINK